MASTQTAKTKRVAVAAGTDRSAKKPAPKKTVATKEVPTVITRKKVVSHKRARRAVVARAAKRPRVSPTPAPATALSTVEPLGESETFVLGNGALS
jgi:hypothetical protein